ncbi:TetR family transcriptional regulator [Burkholderia metallica]|uniref:TetR/AcrR family transcriptional regulator n=1 Tax=Burkholderia metallica TaxID=488729 RepID=UPI00157ACFC2|nr:TetR/AcrR family transcriptional regulator [Burkholderia metallica]NTZ88779.1 TetR family transcriptional regulator [Burkholderia metallica]
MTHDPIFSTSASRHVSKNDAEPVGWRRGLSEVDREARRAELLKAAVSVIAEEGFAGASLRKVAQRAGCTTGAVTYYFSNKEQMITAVAENLYDQFDLTLEGAQHGIGSIFGMWLKMINADDCSAWKAAVQMLTQAPHQPALLSVYQRRCAQFREAFATILAREQSRGTVRKDIPAVVLADHISATVDGWMVRFPMEPEGSRSARIQALVAATVSMIAPPPTASDKICA